MNVFLMLALVVSKLIRKLFVIKTKKICTFVIL